MERPETPKTSPSTRKIAYHESTTPPTESKKSPKFGYYDSPNISEESNNFVHSPIRSTSFNIIKQIDEAEYQNLAKEIITSLLDKNFKAIVFDFDGTLTKFHTERAIKSGKFDAKEDCFADKALLEMILKEGQSNGIKFYIASKQREELIKEILEHNNLQNYFDEIHGSGSNINLSKHEFIEQLPEEKILYLDDCYEEEIKNEKIKTITGLLNLLSPTKKLGVKDFDGEGGLTYEKWEKVVECLKGNFYKISKKTSELDNHPDFGSPLNKEENLYNSSPFALKYKDYESPFSPLSVSLDRLKPIESEEFDAERKFGAKQLVETSDSFEQNL